MVRAKTTLHLRRSFRRGACMRNLLWMFHAAVLLCAANAASAWTPVSEAQRNLPCTVRIGISSFAAGNPNQPIVSSTLSYLSRSLPGDVVCSNQFHSTELLLAEMRRNGVDFLISSSGLYRRALLLGAKDLGVVSGPHISDPNRAEGSAFIVRAEDEDLRTLEDVQNRILAANLERGFSGFQTAIREIVPLSPDPLQYFKRVIFLGRDQRDVLRALEDGRADVGTLKTCLLEIYEAENPAWRGKFKVINEKHYEGFGCKVSTRLYPNWVFAVMPRVDSNRARRVATAILAMPPTPEGLFWSIGTDFSEVDALMQDLRIGPFSILDDWSLEMLWLRYKVPLSILLTLILGGLVHAWRSERLVRLRTTQLTEAHEAERRLESEARDVEAKLAAVTKTVTIGQMSSMVAHELRQPLAAVEAYARGLERMAETKMPTPAMLSETLGKITRETARANAIVEQVRRYARSKSLRREEVLSHDLLHAAQSAFLNTSRGKRVAFRVEDERPAGEVLSLWVDRLEVDLALANLLKNAADAAMGSAAPSVALRLRHEAGYAVYTVADNGPRLSDEAFAQLSVPLSSEKPEGLGLGLSITRSIAEAHGGNLELRRRTDAQGCGIEAVFSLPESAQNNQTFEKAKGS